MTKTDIPSPVQVKLEDLCHTLITQPEFDTIRLRIDQFMINDAAKAQYTRVSERGEYLQHKQAQGLPLSESEVEDFEKDRQALLNDPVARGFLDAQEQMQRMQESVSAYVQKTFELGRVPTPGDLDGGSCGHGCGCHH